MHILYVEDNYDDAALVNRYVETTEHILTVVSTVDEAKDMLANDIDLILLDVLIDSKRLGLDFASELRTHGWELPMVAVTALATAGDMQHYSEIGFDGVLVKPFTIIQLADLIDSYA